MYRTRHHRDGSTSAGWFPMNKDVGSLIHYQEQAMACNRRYLDALAVVDDPAPAYQELRQLTEPKVVAGRSYAGCNPARREDVGLFAAVLDGDHVARGFRNKDVRAALFDSNAKPASRQGAAVGRLVKGLHVRQLVAKILAHTALACDGKRPPPAQFGRPTLPPELARTPGCLTPKTSPHLAEKFRGK